MTVHARAFPSPIVKLAEVDSTNAECMRRARAGERGPLWISAERQTAGRGRQGRSWSQPVGNLAASFLFAPEGALGLLHQLALVTGVAVHDAICTVAGAPIEGLRLKWPNDVLIGHGKLVGILVETTTFAGTSVAVAGIGVNIAHTPDIADRALARLVDHAADVTADTLLPALDTSMHRWLGRWQGGNDFAGIRSAWIDRAGPVGEPLAVNAGAERIVGTFRGIDDGGALLLRDADGKLRRLTYGDVCLAGAAGSPPKGTGL